jgi:hypothetical protein
MNLKQLINESTYGTIGYISSQDDLNLLEQYILYNHPVLKEYKQVIVATNYSNLELIENNSQLWKKYFPECILLDSQINRGHNFGTADLDNMLFDYCKENHIKWLCKSANDIILEESIFNILIEQADFYYLEGIGYGDGTCGISKYNFNFDEIIKDYFYPQTNFYFINVNKTDYLNNQEYLNETYQYSQNTPNYNGKIWEYVKGWSCEDFLKQCVERNNLLKYHLISEDNYRILLQVIKNNNIHDCSHKNIMIEGVCHFQYNNQQIIKIC